jgi:outer membrane protein assembly factor BamB
MLCRLLLTGILLFWGAAGAQAASGDWAQFQHDDQRSGQITVSTAVLTPNLAWSKFVFSAGGTGVENTAIVNGNTVYVFAGNVLLALNRDSGETLWTQNLEVYDQGAQNSDQISTPAYGDGKIFIATFDGYVMAFNALIGNQLWNRKISQRGFQCPVTYSGGYIYVGDGGTGGPTNNYFCLDESGNLCWTYTTATAGYLWCGCSVIGDYLVFGDHEGVITSVYRDTGAVADQVFLGDPDRLSFAVTPGMIRSSVAYQDGYVYTSSENGTSVGYLWKVGFNPESGQFINAGFVVATGFSTSTPVVYNGRIYVGQGEHGNPGSLICVDDTEGSILWSYPVEAGVKSSPALELAGGKAYIYFTTAMPDGFLYCLSEDGQLVWKYNLPDTAYVMQGPAAADGCLYQGDSSGYLYCLRDCSPEEQGWPSFQQDAANSGVTASSAPTQTPVIDWQAFTHYRATHGIDHPATLADGKVFVDDVDDYAWAFDQNTGQALWSTQLDTDPVRFNLSTPAYGEGKVFIATANGYIYALDAGSGQILWSGKLTQGQYQLAELSTQVKYSQGKVYVGSYEGNYYCLDAAGQDGGPLVIWERPGTSYQWWSGAAIAGQYLLFGDSSSVITAVYKDTGIETDQLNLTSLSGAPAGAICSAIDYNCQQQQIYLTSQNGYAWRLGFDPLTGLFDLSNSWHVSIGTYSKSTPAEYGGKVYVCSGTFNSPGGLYCLNAADGSVLWQHDFGDYGTEASPAISVQGGNPYIYISLDCQTADAYCFDGSGNIRWEFQPGQTNYTLAGDSIAGGRVFCVNDSGYIYALGPAAVRVTGVSLDKNASAIAVGASDTLTATVAPGDATNQGLTWTSSNASVATVVYSGTTCTITGVSAGSAAITVTTADGSFTATCAVTVSGQSGSAPSGANGGTESFPLVNAPPSYFEKVDTAAYC